MPIPFTCPHCGKFAEVADQYAGQSGPCAGCGKQVTIPGAAGIPAFAPPAYGPPAKSSGSGATIGVVLAVCCVGLLMCGGVLVALLLPAVQAAREAARRMQSMNNMKQLSLAMMNYHDVYQSFPPAVVKDASGQPLYSGRVLLLPFMEHQNIHQQWQFDKAWNSPENQPLSSVDIKLFHDPSAPPSNATTDYFFVVGPGTMHDGSSKLRMADITDGTSNTLAFIELKGQNTNWAEPKEWDATKQPWPLPGNHPGGNLVGMYDGSVRLLPSNTPPQTIEALRTRAGGELVPNY